MNLTYVVADLHGADDLLHLAVERIQAHGTSAPAGNRTVVFLGDYIDRGPSSRQVIERLMAGPPEGWRWLCLKGNHEDMLLATVSTPLDLDWWLGNGGDATLRSYGHQVGKPPHGAMVPPDHLAWIEALPLMHADANRVFVHAGVDPTLALGEQVGDVLLWSRASNARGHGGRFVVHGHTPHPSGPVTDGQSINLDTLAWSTGRLVVGVFDDDRAGGPIDLIEIRRGDRDNPGP